MRMTIGGQPQSDVLAACLGAEVVLGVLPSGDFGIVRGGDLLREIEQGRGERQVHFVYVPIADRSEADRLGTLLEAH